MQQDRHQCRSHEEPFVAASLDSQAFLCRECLLNFDMNERIAYYSDFLKDNYEVQQKLGEGGYGKVYKASNKIDGKNYAIKVIKDFDTKPQEMKDHYLKEVKVHAGLKHRNIIKYKQCFIANGNLYQLIELGQSSIQSKFQVTSQKKSVALNYII